MLPTIVGGSWDIRNAISMASKYYCYIGGRHTGGA